MPAAETLMPAPERKEVAYQVRCTRSWLERVEQHAEALGLSAAAYIRMATTLHMDNNPVHVQPEPKPKPRRKPD